MDFWMMENRWVVEYEVEVCLGSGQENYVGGVTSTVLYLHDDVWQDKATLFFGDGSKIGSYTVNEEGIRLLDDLNGGEFSTNNKPPADYNLKEIVKSAVREDTSQLFNNSDLQNTSVSKVYRRPTRNNSSPRTELDIDRTELLNTDERDEVVRDLLGNETIESDISELKEDYGN